MLDPAFNLTAVDKVRTNVTSDGSDSGRPVTFDISINLRNTLSDLAVTFDLSAPEDLTMQNQLVADRRTTGQPGDEPANLQHLHGTRHHREGQFVEPAEHFHRQRAEPVGAEQPSKARPELRRGYIRPDRQRRNAAHGLLVQSLENLFNNRVRAVIGGKSSTDADPTENLKENLIDDISLEYMVTKRDNMFVKLFRHTDYESILEGEVIETGVGFVIRKKMLKITDLFRFMKNKVQTQAAPPAKTAANE
ncbi:MAG: hypothetical protein ACLR8Y_20265 [Alistipes indistinctus]